MTAPLPFVVSWYDILYSGKMLFDKNNYRLTCRRLFTVLALFLSNSISSASNMPMKSICRALSADASPNSSNAFFSLYSLCAASSFRHLRKVVLGGSSRIRSTEAQNPRALFSKSMISLSMIFIAVFFLRFFILDA